MIQILLVVLLGIVGVLISVLTGLVGWLALKLFKKELNLDITIKSADSKKKPDA